MKRKISRLSSMLIALCFVQNLIFSGFASFPLHSGIDNTIKTPKASSVETYYWLSSISLSADTIRNLNNEIKSYIDYYGLDAQLVSSPDLYNCHFYAWHSTTINRRWMNQHTQSGGVNVAKYWQDGSYTCIAQSLSTRPVPYIGAYTIPSNVPNGAKVFYGSGDHSAIKVSNTHFRSKWGKYGVYLHKPCQAPYNSSVLLYYTPN